MGVATGAPSGRSGGRGGEMDSAKGEGERGQQRGRGREGSGAVQMGDGRGVGSDGLPRWSSRRGGERAGGGPNPERGR